MKYTKYYYKSSLVNVKIEKRLLPENFSNHSGKKQSIEYIVIHEVSLGIKKRPSQFNLDHYLKKIFLDGFKCSTIGYHFLVSDEKIYQFLSEEEAAHHTGTIEGNQNSIGIERIVCEGINYDYALFNQAKLAATLMVKYNIHLDHVITHYDMQKIYNTVKKKYKLEISSIDKSKNITATSFQNELNILCEIYKKLIIEYPKIFDLHEEFNEVNQIIRTLNKLNYFYYDEKNKEVIVSNWVNGFGKFSENKKLYHLKNIIKFQCLLNRLYREKKNIVLEPLIKEIDGIVFEEMVDAKKCPNRLLIGQRGGLQKFYRQIIHCLKNNWLFEEILDDNNSVIKNNVKNILSSNRTLHDVLLLPKVQEALNPSSDDKESPFTKLVTLCLMDYDEKNCYEFLMPAEIIELAEKGYVNPTNEEWDKFIAVYNRIGDILDKPFKIAKK